MRHHRFIIKKKTDFGYSSFRQRTKDRHSWQNLWIFFNQDRVELAVPTLETIEEMKHDGFGCFVKGFKSYRECKSFERILMKYNLAWYDYSVACVGEDIFDQLSLSLISDYPCPTKHDIEQNKADHRFTLVETDEDVKKIHERDRLKARWIERKCKLYRRLISFYNEKRVYSIDTMELIET
jgi:hypothetical protein